MTNRPTRDEVLMAHAHLTARRSTCQRLHVGALAAREGRILVTGYNGSPSGLPHCDHVPGSLRDDANPCSNVVHAEANVLAFAARHGIRLEGADLFTTAWPCHWCCMLVVNSGISRVVMGSSPPTGARGVQMLSDSGISLVQQ